MTDRELLQQALDALEQIRDAKVQRLELLPVYHETIKALRARLAQKEPEPVAWMHIQGSHEEPCFRELTEDEISRGWTQKPLYYITPPQREFIGLTDEEIRKTVDGYFEFDGGDTWGSYRAIEAKLKEKNA